MGDERMTEFGVQRLTARNTKSRPCEHAIRNVYPLKSIVACEACLDLGDGKLLIITRWLCLGAKR